MLRVFSDSNDPTCWTEAAVWPEAGVASSQEETSERRSSFSHNSIERASPSLLPEDVNAVSGNKGARFSWPRPHVGDLLLACIRANHLPVRLNIAHSCRPITELYADDQHANHVTHYCNAESTCPGERSCLRCMRLIWAKSRKKRGRT